MGGKRDAKKLFRKLLRLRNDVGMLSEEYDTRASELTGNFPQALSHVALVNTAFVLNRETTSRAKPANDTSDQPQARR